LDKRRAQLKPPQVYAVGLDLADYYLEPLKKWQSADEYYRLALAQCGKDEADKRVSLQFKLADLTYFYAGNLDKAKADYTALRAELMKTDAKRARMALIRIGDICRDQGKLDEAKKVYAEAQKDPAFAPKEAKAVAEGRYLQLIESNLHQSNGEAALAACDEWLWFYPLMRLDGKPAVLRCKAHLILKNYSEIIKQADAYLKSLSDPDYAPALHVLAGDACAALNRPAEAKKHYQAVVDNWPESASVKDAKAGLGRVK
jgi:predicted negative regulator of RcsB-dependent stress response